MKDPNEQLHNSDAMARLKRLAKGLGPHFKKASREQQEQLLDFLENWHHALRRKFPRKPCYLPVDFAIKEQFHISMLRNVSAGGAFIEKANGVAVGQETTLVFSFPTLPKPTKLRGEVAWKSAEGFGVKFATSPYTEAGLEKAIERF
jgi:hypothetical protein